MDNSRYLRIEERIFRQKLREKKHYRKTRYLNVEDQYQGPRREELMAINIDSSKQSRARLQLRPTARHVGSASPDLWRRAPPRPTPRPRAPSRPTPRPRAPPRQTFGFALHLARPLGLCSASPDSSCASSISPDGVPFHRQPLQVQAYGPGSKL